MEIFSANSSSGRSFITGQLPAVGDDMRSGLEKEYSIEETQAALNGMLSYKAPSPDDYHAIFFKQIWNLTGIAVYTFVKNILEGGELLEDGAKALFILISKETHPNSIKGFRPISLGDIITKLVTKMIVNKLKEFLKEIISPQQSSFVPGRQCIDNIVTCQEPIHSLRHIKARKEGFVFKLDLEKAYDRME